MTEGQLIGKYRLRERIGEGGMGEVFVAERENEFRQRVAIKVIRPGMNNLEIVRRFVIERQTLASLNHPQIVGLLDGGTTADGLPYLVVDYVENGVPIDQYCESKQLSVTDRLRMFVTVCGAVHHAHQSLIVHCDLKPANILVTPEGVPMLLDFGIAKLLDPLAIGISANVARTRQRAFTPNYASPEQLRGEPVTTATDIYALGVILYELLTGHSPNRNDASAALADWIRSVCEEDAEPPSTVIRRVREVQVDDDPPRTLTPEIVSRTREGDPEKLERRLRGDLDAIVLKALRKQPRDRYGSADQMAEDIRRHLTGRPVTARRNTRWYVARKFLARNKLAVAAAAVLLGAIAVGVSTTLWQARVAARRFEDVRQLAHAFLFDVYDSVENLPGSTPARSIIARTGTEYLDRLAMNARGDARLQRELAEGYLKVGDVEGNPFGANLGDTAKALDNYRKALPLAEAASRRDPRDLDARQVLAQAHYDLGTVMPFSGKAAEGLDHLKTSEQLYREIWTAKPASAQARLNLSRTYDTEGDVLGGARAINLGRDEEAVQAYQRSLEVIPDLPRSDPMAARAMRARTVETLKLGDMEAKAGRVQGALAKYQIALQTTESLIAGDPENSRLKDMAAVTWNKIASLHLDLRENDQAMQAFRRSIDMDEEILRLDPNNTKARRGVLAGEKNLGDLFFYNLSNYQQALIAYRRAADILEVETRIDKTNVTLGQNYSEILTCIADALLKTGKPAEARTEAQRGLAIARELADRPGASSEQVYNYAYLGINIDPDDLQNPDAVLPYALKAVAMTKEKDPFSLHVLAQTYAGKNDYRDAVATEEKALKLFPPPEPGKPTPRVRLTLEHFLEECRAELKKRGGQLP